MEHVQCFVFGIFLWNRSTGKPCSLSAHLSTASRDPGAWSECLSNGESNKQLFGFCHIKKKQKKTDWSLILILCVFVLKKSLTVLCCNIPMKRDSHEPSLHFTPCSFTFYHSQCAYHPMCRYSMLIHVDNSLVNIAKLGKIASVE